MADPPIAMAGAIVEKRPRTVNSGGSCGILRRHTGGGSMNISVIGTGYVGLVTGACFAEFGVHVTCMDKDERRIAQLDKGEIPIYEPGLAELVRKGLSEGRLTFTTDLGQAVETGLAIFIAVGTPSREDGSADLSFVEEVGRGIAAHLNGYKVIVTKSTVPVGTGQRLRELIEQHGPRPA